MSTVSAVRSPEEVEARIRELLEREDKGPLGAFLVSFELESLVEFLPFENAKRLDVVKEGIGPKRWDRVRKPLTREAVLEAIRDYMPFAVGKALDHRGISANRSVSRMQAWLWLLGDDEKVAWLHYANYGAPILKAICELYGWKLEELMTEIAGGSPAWARRQLERFERMAAGKPCRPDCNEGCGR